MREVRHQRIIAPDAGGHGLGMSDGQSWLVEDSLIDLSACPLEGLDEAVGAPTPPPAQCRSAAPRPHKRKRAACGVSA